MVTFFTTAKAFKDKSLVNQVNAIKSWVTGNKYHCQAIIFRKSQGAEALDGLPNIIFSEDTQVTDTGLPYIHGMFAKASLLAANDIVCFINADIIINDEFIESLMDIHRKEEKNYLVVGQRVDTRFDFLIDYNDAEWYDKLIGVTAKDSTLHPPYGSDFFAFPKGQYHDGTLPPLLVGRPGWDNYMIYDARKKNLKLINLSPTFLVIHQDHDYSHKHVNDVVQKKEDDYNLQFLPKNEETIYILTYCNYKYTHGRIKKTYHNFDLRTYYQLERKWGGKGLLKKINLLLEVQLIYLWTRLINRKVFSHE